MRTSLLVVDADPGLDVPCPNRRGSGGILRKEDPACSGGNCYGCHNSKMKTPMGGLQIDTRDGLLRGGDSGKAIVPGDPATSRLVQAVSYTHDLKMPPSGKLDRRDKSRISPLGSKWALPIPESLPRQHAPPVSSKRYDFTRRPQILGFPAVKKPAVPAVKQSNLGAIAYRCISSSKAGREGIDTGRARREARHCSAESLSISPVCLRLRPRSKLS